jgi:hypothetical protein
MRRSVCFLIVPLAVLFGACGHPLRSAEAPHVQLIAESYPPSEIRAAVIRALDKRKFTAEKEDEGRIVARFQKGDESVHIAVEYAAAQFGIRYLGSTGLGETRDASGTLMVDNRYDDMVTRLDKGIAEELKRPAKERAAAERHEREYQAMIQLARTAEAQAQAQIANAPAPAPADQDSGQAAPEGGADPQANPAGTTIVQNNTTVIQNRRDVTINRVQQPASNGSGGWQSFCDKPVKAVWYCPSAPALSACMRNRGSCSAACRVGGGC